MRNLSDFFSFNGVNSYHRRIYPYVTYIMKSKKLYRLESIKAFTNYPLDANFPFDIDYLGEIKKFKIYESKDKNNTLYLLNIIFKNKQRVLQKVKPLLDLH